MSRRNGELSPLRFEWERAIKALPLKPMVKLVALALATYGDLDGRNVRPGGEVLVSDTGASRATVMRAVVELRELGLIESVTAPNRRRGLAEEYRLAVPADVLGRVIAYGTDQVSHRDVKRRQQVSHRDVNGTALGLTQNTLGLTQRQFRSHSETD